MQGLWNRCRLFPKPSWQFPDFRKIAASQPKQCLLGTDLWRVGSWWGELVARPWERTVAESLSGIRTEAERRAGVREGPAA